MNIVEKFEKQQINALSQDKTFPQFSPGDTVKVNLRISEGNNERIQAYEGVVIGIFKKSINTSFIVRKISYGESVEKRFFLYSPTIQSIEVVRRGIVRRAKLYYLRTRRGKAARIKENLNYRKKSL